MEENESNINGVAKHRRFTKVEREKHVEAWKQSGVAASAYARGHGMRAGNLYAWAAKARGKVAEMPGATQSQSQFLPVRIKPPTVIAASPDCGARPRIILKSAALECIIEGAHGIDAFVALAATLKRELFDV